MESVINAHYPKMKKLIQKIPIQFVQSLMTYSGDRAGSESGRKIGLREAIKFANRLSRHEPKMDNEKRIAFSIQDAIDIFAEYAHSMDEKKRIISKICEIHSANHQILKTVASAGSVKTDPSAFFLTYYKPEVSHDDCYLTVGRGRLAVRGALC